MNKKKREKNVKQIQVVDDIHEAALRARINALLKLPIEKRTNFLRKRLPNGGSVI